MNAASVTREVKKQLRLAGLPAYKVTTTFTQLSERSPAGKLFGWQSFVHGLDADSADTVELIMWNIPGVIKTSQHETFVSIVRENQ